MITNHCIPVVHHFAPNLTKTMAENEEALFKAYEEDSRIPCRYGAKCYQKNSVHHEKYKHPPKKVVKKGKTVRRTTIGRKRKNSETKDGQSPEKKVQKKDPDSCDEVPNDTVLQSTNKDDEQVPGTSEESSSPNGRIMDSSKHTPILSLLENCNIDTENDRLSRKDAQIAISHLFLTEMPEDFFHFYELCKSISEDNPQYALKDFQLELIGPYDVFSDKFLHLKINEKGDMLRHWRYYYDPPEFQSILKGDDKDGLHFGYWRESASEKPVFVAKNRANLNCCIEPVAENVFGTVDVHMEEVIKSANPFEKTRLMRLHQQLKNYAKQNDITLERKTTSMQSRQKKVVAKTFHKAGIVVPYERRTQLGYRDLAITDSELLKVLKQIETAATPGERKVPMTKLEEVIRLATIAADECDFGTCLELGHDLFSSGVVQVHSKALQMLSIAYNLLQRTEFIEIAKAHLKDRRKSSNLSVL